MDTCLEMRNAYLEGEMEKLVLEGDKQRREVHHLRDVVRKLDQELKSRMSVVSLLLLIERS